MEKITGSPVTYADLLAAAKRLDALKHIPPVRLIDLPELAAATGAASVTISLDTPHPLDMEGAERAGNSFKLRGAANAVFRLLERRSAADGSITLVTASAGNHAQGVAAAVRRAAQRGLLHEGDRAVVFIPETAPEVKVENTRVLGGNHVTIRKEGETFDAATKLAHAFVAAATNAHFVPPFDDADIIAGQGTLGVELFRECMPDLVFAPCGGGGLAAGLQIAAAHDSPHTRIIAAEPDYASSAIAALSGESPRVATPAHYKGRPVAGGINVPEIGKLPVAIMRAHRTGIVTVTGEMIEYATLLAVDLLKAHHDTRDETHEYNAELAAGTAMAAFLNTPPRFVKGKSVAVVISGANPEWQRDALRDLVQAEAERARMEPGKAVQWDAPLVEKLAHFPRDYAGVRRIHLDAWNIVY